MNTSNLHAAPAVRTTRGCCHRSGSAGPDNRGGCVACGSGRHAAGAESV